MLDRLFLSHTICLQAAHSFAPSRCCLFPAALLCLALAVCKARINAHINSTLP
jgi:hypothetical protein